MKKNIFILVLALASYTAMAQTIWYVDASTTTTVAASNTGFTTAACNNLQTAINAAQTGDQIWVRGFDDATMNSSLVYRPAYDPAYGPGYAFYDPNKPYYYQYFRLRGRSIKIYGGFEGTEILLSDRKNWGTYHSYLGTYVDNTACLINMNGTEVTLDGFVIKDNSTEYPPITLGGMKNQVLANLIIKGNSCTRGSIIADESSSYTNSLVRMFNVEISKNSFPANGSLIHICTASLELYNTTIANNLPFNTSVPSFTTEGQCEFHIYNTIIYRTYGFSLANNGFSNISAVNCIDTRTNPGFVNANPITGDYHLTASSSAIDAGDVFTYYDAYTTAIPIQSANAWERDLDARSRWEGDEIDLGAYEYDSQIFFAPTPQNKMKSESLEVGMDAAFETIALYPTSVHKKGVVHIENTVENAIIRIYSVNGTCITTQTCTAVSASFTAPENVGIYVVTVNALDGSALYQGKIVVTP